MYYYFFIICCQSADRLSASGVFHCGEFCRLFLTVASGWTQTRPNRIRFRSGSKQLVKLMVCANKLIERFPIYRSI